MLSKGDRAPSFQLSDLEGRPHRLEDAVAQGPAVAVFWKPTCPTCHLAFPYLKRLVETYPDGWQLLAVSQDPTERTADFARQYQLPFPVLLEGEGWPVSQQYDPDATPTLFLIGPDGSIELVSVGFDKRELNEMARRLAQHLGAAPRVIAEANDGNPPHKPG